MTRQKKLLPLIFLGLALAAMLLLAAALPEVRFKPGVPFSLGEQQAVPGGSGMLVDPTDTFLTVVRGLAAVAAVLFVIYVIIHLLTPEGRKRLLADAVALVVIFLLLELLPRSIRPVTLPTEEAAAPLPPEALATVPVATFTANPPPWVDWLAILGLAAVVTAAAWVALRLLRPPTSGTAAPLEQIGRQAEQALGTLREGGSFANAVIRCYYDMSRVLKEQLGVERDRAMTPEEFEDRLIAAGLPEGAVRQLTRLFEAARYSPAVPGHKEELEAIDCLETIALACRSAG